MVPCPKTPDRLHRGVGGFGYCTECGWVPGNRLVADPFALGAL